MTNTTQPRTAADIRREYDEKAEQLRFRLGRELTEEQFQLVRQYGDAKESASQASADDDGEERFRAFVRHFPGQAPALRAVWQHVLETHNGNSNECGLGDTPEGERPCHDSAA